MGSLWYVSTFLPDYPEELIGYKWSTDGRYILYGGGYECVAGPDEIFHTKQEALEEALHRIRGRIRTMHDEGMEDREYDRSREWADALVDGIRDELEHGLVFDPAWTRAYLAEVRRERGQW